MDHTAILNAFREGTVSKPESNRAPNPGKHPVNWLQYLSKHFICTAAYIGGGVWGAGPRASESKGRTICGNVIILNKTFFGLNRF